MSRIVAFFDMDHTVLAASSGVLYLRYLLRHGQVGLPVLLRSLGNAILYRVGLLDYPSVMARLSKDSSGLGVSDLVDLCEHWFRESAVHHISATATERIAYHRDKGHLVVMLSAATPYLVAPVAHYVGCDEYLCTQLEVVDGKLSGNIVPPDCFGLNKVHWAQDCLAKNSGDLAATYFYSDSYSDLPLLELVGHPVAVNPDPRLRRVARARGWPIEAFM